MSVNWTKSCVYPFKEVPRIRRPAKILGCRIEELLIVYLSIPLGTNTELVSWDSVIAKTEGKLALEGTVPFFGRKNHPDKLS